MAEEASSPHEGIFFVLPYLHLLDLLSVAGVCKSLRDAVRDDIVPGQKLVVDEPLNYRLTDDRLAELAAKSEGRVQVLALINCYNITDNGLLRFVLSNPEITELHVPNCWRLTRGGLIGVARHLRLKKLRIEGVYDVDSYDLKVLRQLMMSSNPNRPEEKRIFRHGFPKTSLPQLDHGIDVDVCPMCRKVGMIFECPRVSCGNKCRACFRCTRRCLFCGVCLAKPGPTCGESACSMCCLNLTMI